MIDEKNTEHHSATASARSGGRDLKDTNAFKVFDLVAGGVCVRDICDDDALRHVPDIMDDSRFLRDASSPEKQYTTASAVTSASVSFPSDLSGLEFNEAFQTYSFEGLLADAERFHIASSSPSSDSCDFVELLPSNTQKEKEFRDEEVAEAGPSGLQSQNEGLPSDNIKSSRDSSDSSSNDEEEQDVDDAMVLVPNGNILVIISFLKSDLSRLIFNRSNGMDF